MKTSFEAASAMLAALTPLVNGGTIKVYTGAEPATVETAETGTLLATLDLSATAFGAPVDLNPGARATANAVSVGDIVADGIAGHFRACASDGTAVWQGTVGVSEDSPDLVLTGTALNNGDGLEIQSLTVTHPVS